LALPRYPTRTLYLKSLGFAEDPFLPIPDPRFLYLSSQHTPLLERLLNVAERGGGLAVVDGDSGVGKSITARRLQSYYQCQPDEYMVSYLFDTPLETEYAVLAAISDQYGLSRRKGIDSQWGELSSFVTSQANQGRSTIILIDNPGKVTREAMARINAIAAHLTPVFVFGYQELAVTLGKVPQAAKAAHRYTLSNLSLEDTVEMIRFRCSVAGRSEPIFSSEAMIYLWEATFGNPGDVTNICGRAINTMNARKLEQADLETVTPITEAYLDSKIDLPQ
jgi:type II secretory pathway predicted ATPase ExeA